MKTYLCIENGEEFTVKAESLEQAQEYAALYGGRVLQELT